MSPYAAGQNLGRVLAKRLSETKHCIHTVNNKFMIYCCNVTCILLIYVYDIRSGGVRNVRSKTKLFEFSMVLSNNCLIVDSFIKVKVLCQPPTLLFYYG